MYLWNFLHSGPFLQSCSNYLLMKHFLFEFAKTTTEWDKTRRRHLRKYSIKNLNFNFWCTFKWTTHIFNGKTHSFVRLKIFNCCHYFGFDWAKSINIYGYVYDNHFNMVVWNCIFVLLSANMVQNLKWIQYKTYKRIHKIFVVQSKLKIIRECASTQIQFSTWILSNGA